MKRLYTVPVALVLAAGLTACNRQPVDLTFSYDRAIVRLPDGTVIDGKCSSWRDYEDGEQLQVVIDGVTYLTHSANVVLIKE